jgi:hypothetical protein
MFLTKDDFGNAIRGNVLDQISAFDDNKLETSINEAVSYMKGLLNNRYDTEAIFTATGDDRHKTVMQMCKAIVLFNMHQLLNARSIPRKRADAYEKAEDWLAQVNAHKINPPDLPLVESDNTRDSFHFGSNPKRNNHI